MVSMCALTNFSVLRANKSLGDCALGLRHGNERWTDPFCCKNHGVNKLVEAIRVIRSSERKRVGLKRS